MSMPTDAPFPTSSTVPTGTGRDDLSEGGVPRGPSTATGGEDVLSRVVQGAHQTIDRLAESAAPHVQRLSDRVQSGTGQVREMSEDWTESLRSTVREHPLAAVATAMAVGLLIARLTR